jgi:hypothetical protein
LQSISLRSLFLVDDLSFYLESTILLLQSNASIIKPLLIKSDATLTNLERSLPEVNSATETNLIDEVSSKKPSRLSNEQKSQFKLSPKQQDIVVGCMLGDLYARKLKTSVNLSDELKQILVGCLLGDVNINKQEKRQNPRLKFEQGLLHKEYLLHLFSLFEVFCLTEPKIYNPKPDKRTGKVYSTIKFQTRSLPCFKELFEIFYPEGKKIVPLNIGDLMTPLSLAFWLSDDGTFEKSHSIVILCTDSFTLEEVERLINVLNDKWNLECYKVKTTIGNNRIAIPRRSLAILQGLLKDIMPPMMLHKIGL